MVRRAVRLPIATPLELPPLPEDVLEGADAEEAEEEVAETNVARAADRRTLGGHRATSRAADANAAPAKPIPFPTPISLKPGAAASRGQASRKAGSAGAGAAYWPDQPNEELDQASSRLRSQLGALRAERKAAASPPAASRSASAPTLERRGPELSAPDWLIRDVDKPAADARKRRLHPIVFAIGALAFACCGAVAASLIKGALDGHAWTTSVAAASAAGQGATPTDATKAVVSPAAGPVRTTVAAAVDAKPTAVGTDDPGLPVANAQPTAQAATAVPTTTGVSRTIETTPRVVATLQAPPPPVTTTTASPPPVAAATQAAPSPRVTATLETAPPRAVEETAGSRAPSLLGKPATSSRSLTRPAASSKQRTEPRSQPTTVAAAAPPKATANEFATDDTPAPENDGVISKVMSFIRGKPASSSAAVATSDVRVHASPASRSASIGVLKAGTAVPAAGCTSWCQVTVDGKTGWVYHTFLNGGAADGH